jgi:2-C-methyl-D-erythritol 4-phosphate cytidylyltransferase
MTAAILVAAGQSRRMGQDKLFLQLAGKPLVAHAWERLDQHPQIQQIVLVVRENTEPDFRELATGLSLSKPFKLVRGGKERQDSVWNGVQALSPETEIVVVQDGARPCCPPELISATILAAEETGAAVAAQRLTDTIKESSDGRCISRHLDRSRLWAVQTPQTFRTEILIEALQVAYDRKLSLTDDTAACELIGQPVRLVESLLPNPKVTSPPDLAYLEFLLTEQGG